MNKVFEFMDQDRDAFAKTKRDEAKRLIDPATGKVFAHMVHRVNCPVCDVDDGVWVFTKTGFDFVKCRGCGLLHVNPQLRPGALDEHYKTSKTAEHWIRLQRKTNEQSWNADTKYLPALAELKRLDPERGRLLDVGCSIGQFLDLARRDGWQVEGVEMNADASNVARREYGLTVHNSKLEDVGYPKESFDVVTLWGVFEHLADPNGMLQSVRPLLRPGGLVLLFVPNGHSLIVRMTREHNSTVGGRGHLWYFTPQTIGKILTKNDFEKAHEFTVLPQLHEIEHFLQYNTLYREPETKGTEEFVIPPDMREMLKDYISRNKLGYKLISIGRKIGS